MSLPSLRMARGWTRRCNDKALRVQIPLRCLKQVIDGETVDGVLIARQIIEADLIALHHLQRPCNARRIFQAQRQTAREVRLIVLQIIQADWLANQAANLFERGFSTKKEQTGGLGLHWCANSVAALAGRMSAESAGPGAGAAFHVLLPVAPPAREAAE